ncbi:undecaprenyldiphospho-muramoylpentapeptide beta-N-acetylglucosaminyltransferase [bacterium]|nr:undecaprenyldiphospho-muramoylpentapeptide beta-N-acetylglucosaminyltransferase [bacterium]
MRILLTGGGTGGHLFPGLAIIDEFNRRRENLLLFVGTRHGIESRIVPNMGIPFRTVWISGLHRGRLWGNLLFPIKMIVSLIQSLIIIIKFKPDVIIGTGGYVTWPVVKAGQLLKKVTVLQEQNEAPGLVMRQLAGSASQVHLSFESSIRHFPGRPNIYVSGNPTRSDLDAADRAKGLKNFNLSEDKKVLFIFGGSQGALGLNKAVIAALPQLMANDGHQILWGTGPRWIKMVETAIIPWKERIKITQFIDHMDMAYGAADLLMCRSGATTVAEITRLGLPAIYIPFPGSAEGHQVDNAAVLEKAGAGIVLLEKDASPDKMTEIVNMLINDEDRLSRMSANALALGRPRAAEKIVIEILSIFEIEEV